MSFTVYDPPGVRNLVERCGEFLSRAMNEQRKGVFMKGSTMDRVQLGRTPLVVNEPIGEIDLSPLPRLVYGPPPDVDVIWGTLVEALRSNARSRGASKRLCQLVNTVAPEGLFEVKDGVPDSHRVAFLATQAEWAGIPVEWLRTGFRATHNGQTIRLEKDRAWVDSRHRLSWAVHDNLDMIRVMPFGRRHGLTPKLGVIFMSLIAAFPAAHTPLSALIVAVRDAGLRAPFYRHFDLAPLRRDEEEQAGLWRDCLGAIDTSNRMPYWFLQDRLVPKVLTYAKFRQTFGHPERYHNLTHYPVELRLQHREALLTLHSRVSEEHPELARPDGGDDISTAHSILNMQDLLR